MATVKKVFGENPEKIVVLDQVVEFDKDGVAEVEGEVEEILRRAKGYVFEEPEVEEKEEEAPAPKKTAPKKPAPRKPAPKKDE